MRKSKLESYEEILKTIAQHHSTLPAIAFACNMDCTILKQRLEFLIESQLVKEEIVSTKSSYTITPRGVTVLKTLTVTRLLERVQSTVKLTEETLCSLETIDKPQKLNVAAKSKKY
jgi:predicted transcriptional regulator